MPIDRIPSAGIESGGVAPSNLSTGAPNWDSSGNLSFNSGYGSTAVAFGCRAWVNFNGTGTVAIRASGNVSSITDNNTGNYTVNFTNSMPDGNYVVNVNKNCETQELDAYVNIGALIAASASFRNLENNTLRDASTILVAVFR